MHRNESHWHRRLSRTLGVVVMGLAFWLGACAEESPQKAGDAEPRKIRGHHDDAVVQKQSPMPETLDQDMMPSSDASAKVAKSPGAVKPPAEYRDQDEILSEVDHTDERIHELEGMIEVLSTEVDPDMETKKTLEFLKSELVKAKKDKQTLLALVQ